MRANDVTARIELANLLWCEKAALTNEIGRDETMRAEAERLEPVGDCGVERNAAVVDGDHRRDPGCGIRDPEFDEAVQLRLELGHRQLVAIGRG
jgi:hypothetical protein